MTLDANAPCPCGKPLNYTACCGRFHAGELPVTAEELMRSRYCAYVLVLTPYLVATWHPDSLGDITETALAKSLADHQWQRLKVVHRTHGGANDSTGTVHFRAHFTYQGAPQTLEEVSRFSRVDGQWRYLDGEVVRR